MAVSFRGASCLQCECYQSRDGFFLGLFVDTLDVERHLVLGEYGELVFTESRHLLLHLHLFERAEFCNAFVVAGYKGVQASVFIWATLVSVWLTQALVLANVLPLYGNALVEFLLRHCDKEVRGMLSHCYEVVGQV